jgi:hypothetical protein
VADDYQDYGWEAHLQEWEELSGWLLQSLGDFFIAYGELERAHTALVASLVGPEMADELRQIKRQRNILAHDLTGQTEDHNDHPALHAGSRRITVEELAALVAKCGELRDRLTALRQDHPLG